MFDIGFFELLLIAVLMLLVLGPERLPVAVKFMVRWWIKLRESARSMSKSLEQDLKIDEIKQDLHNEKILEKLAQQEDLSKAQSSDQPVSSKAENLTIK